MSEIFEKKHSQKSIHRFENRINNRSDMAGQDGRSQYRVEDEHSSTRYHGKRRNATTIISQGIHSRDNR